VLEDDGEPEAIGLLDHLDGRALNPASGERRALTRRRR
jgi:hypothetical protein